MYRDYTYIVTGCTGYVGSVFTKRLLESGCRVVGFARNEKKANMVFGESQPQFVFGDVTNYEDVQRLFDTVQGQCVVIHTVAKVSIGESSAEQLYSVTVDGTKNVLRASIEHGVKKFIHISSTEALPKGVELKDDLSNYIPQPENVRKGYARTKSMADKLVLDAVKNNGLDASILHFACVLGAGDYGVGHMSQLFIDYVTGKLPASIKGGYNCFDINDVALVLPQIVMSAKKGESYIFAGRNPVQINDILDVIAKKEGLKSLVTLPIWLAYVGAPFLCFWAKITKQRPLYTATALAALKEKTDFSIKKVEEEFGYNPRPLVQTVSEHVDFLKSQGKVYK